MHQFLASEARGQLTHVALATRAIENSMPRRGRRTARRPVFARAPARVDVCASTAVSQTRVCAGSRPHSAYCRASSAAGGGGGDGAPRVAQSFHALQRVSTFAHLRISAPAHSTGLFGQSPAPCALPRVNGRQRRRGRRTARRPVFARAPARVDVCAPAHQQPCLRHGSVRAVAHALCAAPPHQRAAVAGTAHRASPRLRTRSSACRRLLTCISVAVSRSSPPGTW